MRVAALIGTAVLLLPSGAAFATPILEHGRERTERAVPRDRFDQHGGLVSIAEETVEGGSGDLGNASIAPEADDILADSVENPVRGLGDAWWVLLQASRIGRRQLITASSLAVWNARRRMTIVDALSRVWFGGASLPVAALDEREISALGSDRTASSALLSQDGLPPSGARNVPSSATDSEDFAGLGPVLEAAPFAALLLGCAAAGALVFVRRARRASGRRRPSRGGAG